MDLVSDIARAWGWAGVAPEQIVGENDFGNLLIKDVDGRYWRLCPEDLYCKVVAHNKAELDALSQDQEFLHDWYMSELVREARTKLGSLPPDRKYCLKIPGVLGGEYGGTNISSISLAELIAVSGHIAKEINGLPDRSIVKFKIVE